MGLLGKIFTWWDGATLGTALELKRIGRKVGTDALGNVYYAAKKGGRRFVLYNGPNDAARIPPEWHAWLHHTIDELPRPDRPRYPWEKPHQPNMTGTPQAYYPAGSILRGGRRAPATGDYEPWTPE